MIFNLVLCYVYYKCFINNPIKNPIKSYLGMRDEVLLNTELPKQTFAIPIEISMCHINWIISECPEICSNLEICVTWDDFIRTWFEGSSTLEEYDTPEILNIPKKVIKKKSNIILEMESSNEAKSIGSGKCKCKGDCSNKRCSCKKSKLMCSSTCHSGRICKNK
jgi:hypothetical protein